MCAMIRNSRYIDVSGPEHVCDIMFTCIASLCEGEHNAAVMRKKGKETEYS